MKRLLTIGIIFFAACATALAEGEVKLAYTKVRDGFWQVWEMRPGVSEDSSLTDTPIDKSCPDWSADGKKLAYVTSLGELWILGVEDKKSFKVPLKIPVFEPKWSKDGKRILFMSPRDVFHDDADIWCVDIDGKNLRMITKRPWTQTNPAWLKDDEILYSDSPELMGDEICRINMNSGDIIRITENKFNDIQPSYLAGQDKIVFASNEAGNYDIWIMNKFGQDRQNLTKHHSHNVMPRPSADGRTVYFISDRTGYLQIYSIDLETGGLKQVTLDKSDKKDFAVYAN